MNVWFLFTRLVYIILAFLKKKKKCFLLLSTITLKNEPWIWKRIFLDPKLRRRKILVVTGAHLMKYLNALISIHQTQWAALLNTDFKSKALLKILISLQITMNTNDEKNYSTEDCANGSPKSSGPTLSLYKRGTWGMERFTGLSTVIQSQRQCWDQTADFLPSGPATDIEIRS